MGGEQGLGEGNPAENDPGRKGTAGAGEERGQETIETLERERERWGERGMGEIDG